MSLGLVSYGSSDESEEEESNESILMNKKSQPTKVSVSHTNRDRIVYKSESDAELTVKPQGKSVANREPSDTPKDVSSGVSSLMNDLVEEPINVRDNDESKTLASLPTPKITQLHNIDFDWSRLTSKRSTQPIKISVPSLANLESEEDSEPVKKKLKASKSGSGLFALLPSPKNCFLTNSKSSLRPRQLPSNQKQQAPPNKKLTKAVKSTESQQLKSNPSVAVDNDDSPDEDEEVTSEKVDFFSLSTPTVVSDSEIHIPIDSIISRILDKPVIEPNFHATGSGHKYNNPRLGAISSTADSNVTQPISDSQVDLPTSTSSYIPLPEDGDLELDQTALHQLCGRRERQSGGPGVELIDIKGEAILPDAREWMTKQLTEEQNVNIHKHNRKDGPTTQQRRKHQITYLAFQAKEHELELKNQWSNNRMSRKQTQAKYGF